MSPQLFVDLDGVFGPEEFSPEQKPYLNGRIAWQFLRLLYHPNPIILTGVHFDKPDIVHQKIQWVRKHISSRAMVICCRSVDKCHYGKPGDILIDDRVKYRDLWVNMGGVFILHTSWASTFSGLSSLPSLHTTPAPRTRF